MSARFILAQISDMHVRAEARDDGFDPLLDYHVEPSIKIKVRTMYFQRLERDLDCSRCRFLLFERDHSTRCIRIHKPPDARYSRDRLFKQLESFST